MMMRPRPMSSFFEEALGAWKEGTSQRTPAQEEMARALQPLMSLWMERNASAWIGMWRRSSLYILSGAEGQGHIFPLVPAHPVDEIRLFKTEGFAFELEWSEDDHRPLVCQVRRGTAVGRELTSDEGVVEIRGWRLALRASRAELLTFMQNDAKQE